MSRVLHIVHFHGWELVVYIVQSCHNGMNVCMQIILTYKYLTNGQCESRNTLVMSGWGNAWFDKAYHFPVTPYQSQYLFSVFLPFQLLLSLNRSECKRITITGMHSMTVIPIVSVQSALTWQVIVCLCACP